MCVLMIYTHVLLSMCSGPFVCFWIERWPLYCIISLATTLQFPISSCFCSKYWLWRRHVSLPASEGPVTKQCSNKEKQCCFSWQGSGSGSWSASMLWKKKWMHLLLDKTDWLYWLYKAPKTKSSHCCCCGGGLYFFLVWVVCASVAHAVTHVHIMLNYEGIFAEEVTSVLRRHIFWEGLTQIEMLANKQSCCIPVLSRCH